MANANLPTGVTQTCPHCGKSYTWDEIPDHASAACLRVAVAVQRVENETAAEDIRNALQVLMGLSEMIDHTTYERAEEDLLTIKRRLWSAVRKLEAK